MNIKSSHECNSNTPSIKGAGLICIVDLRCQIRCVCTLFCCHSDQMGNKGAFITLTKDLKPQFTTYEAVVSHMCQSYLVHDWTPAITLPHTIYRIVGNFRGRKLSWISRFCCYSQKFSLWNLGVWYKYFTICKSFLLWKFLTKTKTKMHFSMA